MAANYGRPKPTDPLWYRRAYSLRIWCGCGRAVRLPLEEVLRRGVPPSTCLYRIISRLRCAVCGERPASADVPHE